MTRDDSGSNDGTDIIRSTRRSFLATAGTTAAGAMLLNLAPTRAGAQQHLDTVSNRPTCVAVDPATFSRKAYTSDDDGKLKVYDLDDTVEPARLSASLEFANPHVGKASYVAVGGKKILTSGYDGKVFIYDPSMPAAMTPFIQHIVDASKPPQVWVVTMSSDGTRALSATNDGQILLWQTAAPDQPAKPFRSDSAKSPVGGLAFVPAGAGVQETMFLSTHGYGEVNLWDINAPKPVYTFSHANRHAVNAVAVTSDGKFFVSAGFDTKVRLWNLKKRKLLKTFKGHDNWIWRVAISPDNDKAVSAGEDKRVRVWDIGSLSDTYKEYGPYPDGVMGVAFTASNKVVVTANNTQSKNPLFIQTI